MAAVGLIAATWHGLSAGRAARPAFAVGLVLLAIGGAVGSVVHCRDNESFVARMAPDSAG